MCGGLTGWQRNYTERQYKMLSGEVPGRYIVGVPVKAGLADVILGYVSGLLWALLTDRVFLIQHIPNLDGECNQRSVEFAYHYRFADWSAAPLHLPNEVFECLLPPYTEGCPGSNNFRVALPGPGNTMSAADKKVVQMFQVNGGYKDKFAHEDMARFPADGDQYRNEVFLFLSNRGVTYHIFDNPYHNSTVRSWGLDRHTAFPCLVDYLFRLKPQACTDGCLTVERELRTLGRPDQNTLRIGIHVRAEHDQDAPEHFYCLDSLIKVYTQAPHNMKVKIMLVTASVGIQETALKKYPGMVLLPNNKVDTVIAVHDRAGTGDGQKPNITAEECKKRNKDDEVGMLNSARDMQLLSLTDIHIISRRSGFGVISAMMRPKATPPIIYRMANHDHDGSGKPNLRECGQELQGDSLSILADEWSGL